MSDGLKNKTLHGLFWSFFERSGQQGIQFIISIILARLLLPEQFGLIAMLTIFMTIAQLFIDSGFGQALIQKKDATHIDECSIFYFNILVGCLAAGLLRLAAPWIAAFYNQPLLTPLTRVLSFNLIINSFGLIQTTLLIRDIDFKTQMKVSMIAALLSGIIGVTMAYRGFGVWSLVAQSLSINLFRTILLWIFHRWRPSLQFSLTSLRTMFAFGSKLLLSGFLDRFFQNIYLLVIGKIFSPAALGFYSRGQKLQALTAQNIQSSVSRVTFPIFSSIQEDKSRLKQGVRKALMTVAMVNFPMMIGLTVIAKPLVLVLLTDKWLPCVPYLQLLCVVGMLYPLHAINLNVLKAQGRSDLFLRLTLIKESLVIVNIVFMCHFGIKALLYGQIVLSIMSLYINTYFTGKLIQYSFKEQIGDVLPYLGTALLMGIGIRAIGNIITTNYILLLVVQVLTGVFLFISFCFVFRLRAFNEVQQILWQKLGKERYCT